MSDQIRIRCQDVVKWVEGRTETAGYSRSNGNLQVGYLAAEVAAGLMNPESLKRFRFEVEEIARKREAEKGVNAV